MFWFIKKRYVLAEWPERVRRIFLRREIELFWNAGKPQNYGIREVYRSRFQTIVRGIRWRAYAKQPYGNTIEITYPQMIELLEKAKWFVKDRTEKGKNSD